LRSSKDIRDYVNQNLKNSQEALNYNKTLNESSFDNASNFPSGTQSMNSIYKRI